MLFSLLKHYLDLYISDTVLKVSRSLYCFTTSMSCGVEHDFPRLWGTGISDAIFMKAVSFIIPAEVYYQSSQLVYRDFTIALNQSESRTRCVMFNVALSIVFGIGMESTRYLKLTTFHSLFWKVPP